MNPPITDTILDESAARFFQFCMIRYNPNKQSNIFRHPDTDVFQSVEINYDGTVSARAASLLYAVPNTNGYPNKEDAD
jgi:hypothetical protein